MTSFNDLSRQQLESAAANFGIAVDGRWSDITLSAKLIEAGVTVDQIEAAGKVLGVTEESKADPASAVTMFSENSQDKRAVLKMERRNQSYSVLGYKFTNDHPFVVMPEEDALWIANTVDGFRIAHPTEASNFYKGK